MILTLLLLNELYRMQHRHEIVEWLPVHGGDGHERGRFALLPALLLAPLLGLLSVIVGYVILPDYRQQTALLARLQASNCRVVQGILQPRFHSARKCYLLPCSCQAIARHCIWPCLHSAQLQSVLLPACPWVAWPKSFNPYISVRGSPTFWKLGCFPRCCVTSLST